MFNWFKKAAPAMEVKANPAAQAMMLRLGQPAWTDREFRRLADEAYVKNAVVHFCIYKIASSAASVKLKLCRLRGDDMEDESRTHPLMKLLDKPNPMQSGDDFIHALISFYLIGGNAYVNNASGKNKELWLFNPEYVKVIEGAAGMPQAYRYQAAKGYVDFAVNPLTGESEVMHWRDFHPLNHWYGLSKIEPAAYGVDTLNSIMAWNKALLDNACIPSGALVASGEQSLSDEQFARIKEQIEQSYSGAENAGKPMLLDGGLDWKPMGASPADMDFLNNYETIARQVGAVFGVPAMLLGIKGDSTFNNMAEARLIFWEDTVLPLLDKALSKLNNWLAPRFGDDLVLYYDKDSITALEPRRAEMHTRMREANWLTLNEKRRGTGYDDLTEDYLDLPVTSLPVDDSGKVTADTTAERQQQGGVDTSQDGAEGA